MDQLRFEEGLGHYSVSAAPESVWIAKGMGTHYFQIQLAVGIPEAAAAAGRLLCLETTLYAPQDNGPRAPLASANVSVPFNSSGEVRRPSLLYLITNAQLLALEQRRTGDLRLELQIRGVLPQAASGFPSSSEVTEHIRVAESTWRQQLAGLGPVGGTSIWTPSHDQRPCSFSTALHGCGRCRPEPRSIAGGRLELLEKATTVTECDWMRSYGRA